VSKSYRILILMDLEILMGTRVNLNGGSLKTFTFYILFIFEKFAVCSQEFRSQVLEQFILIHRLRISRARVVWSDCSMKKPSCNSFVDGVYVIHFL
jgi:hypothetical protein